MPRFCTLVGTLAALLLATPTPRAAEAGVTVIGDVTPGVVVSGQDVEIGAFGYGEVVVDGGSQLETPRVTLGDYGSAPYLGVAVARVRGAGSLWSIQQLELRDPFASLLDVADGGQMLIDGSWNNGGAPDVRVDGPNSVLSIGSGVAGDVHLTNGGRMLMGDSSFPEGSEVQIDEGILSVQQFDNRGRFLGGGDVHYRRMGSDGNAGTVEVGDQDRLSFQSYDDEPFLNRGQITVAGGEFYAVDGLWNQQVFGQLFESASITLADADLRVGYSGRVQGGHLLNEGRIASVGGVSNVHGPVLSQNGSSIAAANDSVLLFHDTVVLDSATLSVFAGSRAVFLSDLEIVGDATLLAQLPGSPGGGFGVAEVVGQFLVDGQVQVSMAGGYTAQPGDVFPLVTASGGIVGAASLAAAPPLPDGLHWRLQTDANTLSLAVVEGLPGDFNADGVVDAADYTVWRDGLGVTYQPADYQLWRDYYGQAAAPEATNAAPEPGAALLVVLVVCGVISARRAS